MMLDFTCTPVMLYWDCEMRTTEMRTGIVHLYQTHLPNRTLVQLIAKVVQHLNDDMQHPIALHFGKEPANLEPLAGDERLQAAVAGQDDGEP